MLSFSVSKTHIVLFYVEYLKKQKQYDIYFLFKYLKLYELLFHVAGRSIINWRNPTIAKHGLKYFRNN